MAIRGGSPGRTCAAVSREWARGRPGRAKPQPTRSVTTTKFTSIFPAPWSNFTTFSLMNAKLPENPYHELAWIAGQPEIGPGCWIGAFTLVDGLGGLKIGRGCNISSGAQVLSHSTARRCVSEKALDVIDRQPTEIGDFVFIGANAVVLMGCKVGHHSIIGAGAVLTEGMEIPPYSLVVGVPARVTRSIEAEAASWRAEGASLAPLVGKLASTTAPLEG